MIEAKNPAWRAGALGFVLIALLAGVMSLEPIRQSAQYHDFADRRALLGVPNLLDVASNIAFVVAGGLGLAFCAGPRRTPQVASWRAFFAATLLTGFGSAYYHLAPTDATLAWDRLPMALAFTALLVALFAEHAGDGFERLLLAPAMAVGAMSVLWWRWSGDLRPYYWVQLAPLIGIPLIVALFPARHSHRRTLFLALGLYALAKACEIGDRQIFDLTGHVVSGHTLKHLLAAGAIFALLLMLRRRGAARA